MATFSKTYDFAAGTTAVADQVDQNFDDLLDALNNHVVHLDGSKTMTGGLNLPAADPTSDNQAARKKYVDDLIAKHKIQATYQIGPSGSWGTGDIHLGPTINSPGYNWRTWANANLMLTFSGTGSSQWDVFLVCNGTDITGYRFTVSADSTANLALQGRQVELGSAANAVWKVRAVRLSGSLSLVTVNDARFNRLDIWHSGR